MSYFTSSFDDEVVRLIRGGGVGFMPSDTIYGLSSRALDESAVERVRRLKDRHENKLCIVLIADVEMLDLLSIDKFQAQAAEKYWPGSLTLECQAPKAPLWLHRGQKYFGVRIPDNQPLLGLIQKTGPIISTSANKEGSLPATTYQGAEKIFGDELDFYVDVGLLDSQPSTLAKAVNGRLTVVRPGAVKIS